MAEQDIHKAAIDAEEIAQRNLETLRNTARNFLSRRQAAYQKVFGAKKSPTMKTVLDDLSSFCREHQTCFDPDARIHAVNEGRREVILRIREHMNLPLDELWEIYQ